MLGAPEAHIMRTVTPRRAIQLALGLLWLLDAALQYQPYMYTSAFPQSLAATAPGNPAAVAGPITWAAGVLAHHLVVGNTAFATTQLLIGLGLLWRRSVKAALVASIVWSLGIWWFGEGLGGALTGAGPVAGFPGAVVLYSLLALLAWPHPADEPSGAVATSGPLGRVLPRAIWTVLWTSLAYAGHSSIGFAIACAAIAASVWSERTVRAGLILAAGTAAGIWVAQNFGAITSGQSTDPNTGPLLILLAAAFWPLRADGHPYDSDTLNAWLGQTGRLRCWSRSRPTGLSWRCWCWGPCWCSARSRRGSRGAASCR